MSKKRYNFIPLMYIYKQKLLTFRPKIFSVFLYLIWDFCVEKNKESESLESNRSNILYSITVIVSSDLEVICILYLPNWQSITVDCY